MRRIDRSALELFKYFIYKLYKTWHVVNCPSFQNRYFPSLATIELYLNSSIIPASYRTNVALVVHINTKTASSLATRSANAKSKAAKELLSF